LFDRLPPSKKVCPSEQKKKEKEEKEKARVEKVDPPQRQNSVRDTTRKFIIVQPSSRGHRQEKKKGGAKMGTSVLITS